MTFLEELKQRGAIADITNEMALSKLLENESIGVYCGIDPTEGSAHVGHLCPFMLLARLQRAGHKPTVLIGEFTASCGDPSFKEKERDKISLDVINTWATKLTKQMKKIISFDGENAAQLVNNKDWFGSMPVQVFLRDIGRYFSVNNMIRKKSVKQRLDREEKGISYTEFSYSLLQGYDFAHLSQQGVLLQIGGNDQMGNIISGIDLTKKLHGTEVFGMTMPLILKDDGKKFGKTETGTVWLDSNKTSPYAYYQFWLNTQDVDVEHFLKIFTFLSLDTISEIVKIHNKAPHMRGAQKVLAEQATKYAHGNESLKSAIKLSETLFKGKAADLTMEDFKQLESSAISKTTRNEMNASLAKLLVDAGLAKSATNARYLIKANSISLNGNKINDQDYKLQLTDNLYGRYSLISKGKKSFALVI